MASKIDLLSTQELLNSKISDLRLSLKNPRILRLIDRVRKELKTKGLKVNPIFWFSNEWFCPDGILGIAIPFYLGHPRLIELEKNEIGFVEGETEEDFLRLFRHELGHVIDNAFLLRRNRNRQEIFGKSSVKYPFSYRYNPRTKSFVKNLEDGYAQSHPSEDFAETFAVWLNPKSKWRTKYSNWSAYKKLIYMNSLMNSIKNKKPIINTKEVIEPISEMNITLKEFYRRKRKKLKLEQDRFWDTGITNVFSSKITYKDEKAISFIRENKRTLIESIHKNTGEEKYIIQNAIQSFSTRIKELDLYLAQDKLSTRRNLSYYLTRKVKNYVKEGRDKIIL